MDLKAKYRKNERIVYREEEEGAFLFDPDTGNLKYMNGTGREAFTKLVEQKEVEEISRHLQKIFPGVASRQLEGDLDVFLKDLEVNGFILPL